MTSGRLFCSFLLAAGVCCIGTAGCENDERTVNTLTRRKTGVEEAVDVKVNYTMGGRIQAILSAPLMLNVNEAIPYIEFPKTLHVDFYDPTGKKESRLDARYGKYEQHQSKVLLRDSVVVINMEKGDTLLCQELYWDRNRTGTEFYTDKPVRIRTRTEVINGRGMEAGQDFKNWHITETFGSLSVPATQFPQ